MDVGGVALVGEVFRRGSSGTREEEGDGVYGGRGVKEGEV